ncbi:MAG: hypothetical protein ACREM3_15255 [Candidatus Rokuibacteriota bacterium]
MGRNPQIFNYEAVAGPDTSLDLALRGLVKLARLNDLVTRGLAAEEDCPYEVDAPLLQEIAGAIYLAALTVAEGVEPSPPGDELGGPRARRALDKNRGGA